MHSPQCNDAITSATGCNWEKIRRTTARCAIVVVVAASFLSSRAPYTLLTLREMSFEKQKHTGMEIKKGSV